jgi:hypothetical protein
MKREHFPTLDEIAVIPELAVLAVLWAALESASCALRVANPELCDERFRDDPLDSEVYYARRLVRLIEIIKTDLRCYQLHVRGNSALGSPEEDQT